MHERTGRTFVLRAIEVEGGPSAVVVDAGFAMELFYRGGRKVWLVVGGVNGEIPPFDDGVHHVVVRTAERFELRGPAWIGLGHPRRGETRVEVRFEGEPTAGYPVLPELVDRDES